MILGFAGVGGGVTAPGNAGWSPYALGSALRMWNEADNVTSSGGAVSDFLDKSGNGRAWSQSTLAKKPTLTASAINGRPALYFDSAGKIMTGVTFSGLSTSIAFFAVFVLDADPPAAGLGGIWQLSSATGTETYIPYAGDGKIYDDTFATARKSTNVALGAGYFASPRIYACYSAANDWRLYTDGVSRYTTATNTVSFPTSATSIGADFELASSVYMRGKLALTMAVSPAPDPAGATWAQIHTWLGARYGITVP